jgi:SAM-dependent methyltransferase
MGLEATTCWSFATQSPAGRKLGNARFNGVTPALAVYNLLRRYTRPGDVVVDPMAGSGTTIDVARTLGRRVLAFDLAPARPDIHPSDARNLPLPDDAADLVFVDSPYSDNLRYSDHPDCLGRLSCRDPRFFDEMEKVARETHRILKPGRVLGWVISDEYRHGRFTPVGFLLFSLLCRFFHPVDIVCLVRRNDRSLSPLWEHRARKHNFFLRGFKYLLILRKAPPEAVP